jgi:hypothetical protein
MGMGVADDADEEGVRMGRMFQWVLAAFLAAAPAFPSANAQVMRAVPNHRGAFNCTFGTLRGSSGGGTLSSGTNYVGISARSGIEASIKPFYPVCNHVAKTLVMSIIGGTPGASKNYTATVRINQADTAITCNAGPAATSCTGTGSVNVIGRVTIDIKVVVTVGATLHPVSWTLQ